MLTFLVVLVGTAIFILGAGLVLAARARHIILSATRERANLEQLLQEPNQRGSKQTSTSHAA